MNGVTALRGFFGTDGDTAGVLRWMILGSNGETQIEECDFRFYNARANNPDRTEWRMYYSGELLGHASSGDLLILIRSAYQKHFGLVAPWESVWLAPILGLFEINEMKDDIQGLLKTVL